MEEPAEGGLQPLGGVWASVITEVAARGLPGLPESVRGGPSWCPGAGPRGASPGLLQAALASPSQETSFRGAGTRSGESRCAPPTGFPRRWHAGHCATLVVAEEPVCTHRP